MGAVGTAGAKRPARRPHPALSRRRLLEGFGWGGIAALVAASFPMLIRFLQPSGRAAGRSLVDAGPLADYRTPSVTSRWVARHGLWIVNRDGRLYALEARCTHLGCTPRWMPGSGSFHCPCHGSRFTPEGEAINGPAVTPLLRFAIRVEDDQVIVDRSRRTSLEQAETDPRFFVRV
jgi:cytochrome b6-f complex iron-sulfur subunit